MNKKELMNGTMILMGQIYNSKINEIMKERGCSREDAQRIFREECSSNSKKVDGD